MLLVGSCGGTAPTPAAPARVDTPPPKCGNVEVTKIVGTWKTDNGPTASEFTFKQDCTIVANIEKTGEESGNYALPDENTLQLSFPGSENTKLGIKFESANTLVIEDVTADIKLVLQRSNK